jgi:hypothetical protein
MNRRALLASFLAAPAAVKLAPWVKPTPDVFSMTLGGPRDLLQPTPLATDLAELQLQAAVLAMFAGYRSAAEENARQWCVAMDAARHA